MFNIYFMADFMELTSWMETFRNKLVTLFDSRLLFLGLQGSYARGEQTPKSDIDVVVILDKVNFIDLKAYRHMLDTMERRELICGFLAGEEELRNWEKSDLLQLILDTRSIVGSLDYLFQSFSHEDVRRAVLSGACNIYHACSHNFLHARSRDMIVGLYKSARFTVRMKHFMETGDYIASMAILVKAVSGYDRCILETVVSGNNIVDEDAFENSCCQLLEWAIRVILDMGEKEKIIQCTQTNFIMRSKLG